MIEYDESFYLILVNHEGHLFNIYVIGAFVFLLWFYLHYTDNKKRDNVTTHPWEKEEKEERKNEGQERNEKAIYDTTYSKSHNNSNNRGNDC